ncbi:MAG: EpsI family protein [Desulfobacteraceae bacterium]|nr:EpsI family protein [Desulfobacteraceae bacterium]
MSYKRTITIIVIMLLTATLLSFLSNPEIIRPNKSFDSFPLKFGKWQGVKSKLDKEIYNSLGVDDYFFANYRSTQGEIVNLYIGFYQTQKEGDLIHSPKNCMPALGWNIIDTSIEKVNLTNTDTQNFAKLLLQKGSEKQIVLYWFQSRGRIISSGYMQKIWLVIDSITKHRTDGSFVRLISMVTDNEEESLELLIEFAKNIYPSLNEFIPS